MEFLGIPAVPGYAIGPAKILRRPLPGVVQHSLEAKEVDQEIKRFHAGREACRRRLETLQADCLRRGDEEHAAVLEAHLELLLDEELEKDVSALIRGRRLEAEQAVESVLEETIRDIEGLEQEYSRRRADDFRDLKNQLLRGISEGRFEEQPLAAPVILMGRDIGPSDTAAIDSAKLLAIVSERGGATSHVVIVSRNLGIPAVVGAKGAMDAVREGDMVLVDGSEGRVFIRPDREVVAGYFDRMAALHAHRAELAAFSSLPAVTKDGCPVELLANAESETGVETALRAGAAGIGLFRTEFLFLREDRPPSEEEQFRVYREVATRLEGRAIVFRTFDLGGDKPSACLPLPVEANPFLGCRGMRVYPDCVDVFRAQLRAILRAGSYGRVKVMFPMVTSLTEVMWLKTIVEEAKRELQRDGLPFDQGLPVGIMIETPAAAMIAEELIEPVDFFSIGTNDLTQYTLAVDRGNERISGIYDPLHPAVLRLIKRTIEAAHARGKPVSVCGELAGDETASAILLGLGLRSFSVSPERIPTIKQKMLEITLAEAESRAEAAVSRAEPQR